MMSRQLNHLAIFIIIGFMLIGGGTVYWTVLQHDNLLARDDNPRKVLAELNLIRGTIYDRNGEQLAYSVEGDSASLGAIRVYPHPEVVAAVGHYSYQFGESGLEEGFDSWLRGEQLRDAFAIWQDDLLNRPTIGGDVQSTLDLELQQTLFNAMQPYQGAALVVHVPSGDILAMVSLPTYDPNDTVTLQALVDAQNEEEEQSSPVPSLLLNRVTTGQYQPGGTLQTLILSDMLASGQAIDLPVNLEEAVLTQPDLTLPCAFDPALSDSDATLADAYRLGCPTPFIDAVGEVVPVPAFQERLVAAGFGDVARVQGIDHCWLKETNLVDVAGGDRSEIAAAAAGQSALTVTPIHLSQLIATVVNEGNGVSLSLAHATRYPNDGGDWQPIQESTGSPALMQPNIATAIQNILRENNFGTDDIPVYGHVSFAYAGERQYLWFLGWTPLADGTDAIMVLVIELPADQQIEGQLAIDVAIEVLQQASNRLNAPQLVD